MNYRTGVPVVGVANVRPAALPMGGTLEENSIMRVFHAVWASSFFTFFHTID